MIVAKYGLEVLTMKWKIKIRDIHDLREICRLVGQSGLSAHLVSDNGSACAISLISMIPVATAPNLHLCVSGISTPEECHSVKLLERHLTPFFAT